MNQKFRQCLADCKQLNTPGLLQKAGVDPASTNIAADKILYNHAIQMVSILVATISLLFEKVRQFKISLSYSNSSFLTPQCQSAALDELFGNPEDCFQRYQTAQILLHSLSQQVHHQQDRALLTKCKFMPRSLACFQNIFQRLLFYLSLMKFILEIFHNI